MIVNFLYVLLMLTCSSILYLDTYFTSKIIAVLGGFGFGLSLIRGFVVFFYFKHPSIEVFPTKIILNTFYGKKIVKVGDILKISIVKDKSINFYLSSDAKKPSNYFDYMNLISWFRYRYKLKCITNSDSLIDILLPIIPHSKIRFD